MATSLLLLSILAPGAANVGATNAVTVSVLGEGSLRFSYAGKAVLATSATLAPNAAGLLADEKGRVLLPQTKVPAGQIKIAMNGTITVGTFHSRLVLVRSSSAGTEIGYPGEGTFGVLDVKAKSGVVAPVGTSAKTAAVATGKATIVVRDKNELATEHVRLGDVADLTGDAALVNQLGAIDLGFVPPIGSRRTLTEWSIRAALNARGFRDDRVTLTMPPESTVARASQTVTANDLIAKAKEAAQSQLGVENMQLQNGPAPARVANGELNIRGEAQRTGEIVTVTVVIEVDGHEATRRSLRFNAPVGGVKAGDAVKLKVERNGATVEIDARAKSAGAVGTTVQVTTNTGTVLTATVTGNGTAEVKL